MYDAITHADDKMNDDYVTFTIVMMLLKNLFFVQCEVEGDYST